MSIVTWAVFISAGIKVTMLTEDIIISPTIVGYYSILHGTFKK